MTYLGKSKRGDLATDQGNTECSPITRTCAPAGSGSTRCSVDFPHPLAKLSNCKTDTGCSSALNLGVAAGSSEVSRSILSQNWGCAMGNQTLGSGLHSWHSAAEATRPSFEGIEGTNLKPVSFTIAFIRCLHMQDLLVLSIFVRHRICAELSVVQIWAFHYQWASCRGLTISSSLLYPACVINGCS